MKEDDKKQPGSGQQTTGNEPVQPGNNAGQDTAADQPEGTASDEGYAVVGSGLGIDE